MIDFGDKNEPDDYRVIVALYDSDRLVQMLYKYKYNGVSKEGNKKVFSVNGLVCGSDYDRIKIMAIENLSNIKPIARAFESIREE